MSKYTFTYFHLLHLTLVTEAVQLSKTLLQKYFDNIYIYWIFFKYFDIE